MAIIFSSRLKKMTIDEDALFRISHDGLVCQSRALTTYL
jgi:hypothetical protein